jgi:hypothetical protein
MMAVVSTADLKKIMECTTRLRTENESLSFALQAIVSAYQNESDEHQRLEKEIRLYQERIDITRAEVERSNLALQIKRDELEVRELKCFSVVLCQSLHFY